MRYAHASTISRRVILAIMYCHAVRIARAHALARPAR